MVKKNDAKSQSVLRAKIDKLDTLIDSYINKNIVSGNTVEIGNLFTKWCLYYLFERSEDEQEEDIKYNGANDNSIDALFEQGDKLFIVQAKYNNSHKWEAIPKFVADIKRLANNIVVGDRQEIKEASALIQNYINEKKEISLYYITNNNIDVTFERPKVKNLSEELEGNYYNFSLNVFGLDEINEYIEDKLNDIPKKYDGAKLCLGICSDAIEADDTLIAQVSLKDFFDFVSKGDEFLYYSNIRNYLKRTDVNKGIENTLRNESNNFWYYNNGVTIVCDEWRRINRVVSITTPQIVNGCQTANSIKLFFKGIPNLEYDKHFGKLLVKIIMDRGRGKRNLITQYTNSQNSVKGKDFYSLNGFQREKKSMLEEVGYFYEIQSGSALAEKSKFKGEEKYKYLLPDKFDNVISAKDLVQSYVSGIKQHPGIAYGKAGELTPVGDKWNLVTEDAPFSIEYFLYSYLVFKYAKTNLDYNSKSKDFKRSASLFFVYTYFKMLTRILVKAEQLDPYNVTPLNISLSQMKKVFLEETYNKELLNTVNRILRDFFKKDSTILRLISDNLIKFLKIDVENVETNEILLKYIDMEIEDNENFISFFR